MIAALGPFFAVDQHAPGSPAEPPWHSMAELVDDPSVLRERITQTRAYLGAVSGQEPDAIEVRVAASVTHLGLVARLISPALAAAVLDNRVPILSLAQLHWQPVLGGAFPLSLPELPPATPDNLVERLQLELLNGPVAAVTRAFEISAHILVGNVASALNGAATPETNTPPPPPLKNNRP
ncbi:hypothetical protein, partial [Kribbella solani]|uniref:hypothetical protein n=1 Tax=Kribbella solani TaxID=236067 RepID=UPI0029B4A1DD